MVDASTRRKLNDLEIRLEYTVGLGTLVSAYLYEALKKDGIAFQWNAEVMAAVTGFPPVKTLTGILKEIGAPVRFSEIGIDLELFKETIKKAHTVKTRYTVLILFNELGLTDDYLPQLAARFY